MTAFINRPTPHSGFVQLVKLGTGEVIEGNMVRNVLELSRPLSKGETLHFTHTITDKPRNRKERRQQARIKQCKNRS